jgi:hypothetical protein
MKTILPLLTSIMLALGFSSLAQQTVTFKVTHDLDGTQTSISGAVITIAGITNPLTTSSNGETTITLADGTYTYGVKAEDFVEIIGAQFTVAGEAKLVPVTMYKYGSILDAVNLGTAGNYVILAKTAISNIPISAVTGNLGLSPAATSYITGFDITNATGYATSSQVTGKLFAADMADPTPIKLTTAVSDMELAYTDAAGRATPDFLNLGVGEIGGKTLAPGLYKWTSTVTISGNVTLTGNANDIWIFQIDNDLTMSPSVNVFLSGGAQNKNIFWQVAGEVLIGTDSHFEGIILSKTGIYFQTGASFNGRALAQTAVTLDQNAITGPTGEDQDNKYEVFYNANNANVTGNIPVDANEYEEGDLVTVLGKGNLVLAGHTFKGWNTQEDGSGTIYQENNTFSIGVYDITLYALWEVVSGIGAENLIKPNAYPNPFSNSISITNADKVRRVIIYNSIGKQLMNIQLLGQKTINTAELPSGIYLISIENNNGEKQVKKLIKQ